jgi:arylsulfatase A-like enzyme
MKWGLLWFVFVVLKSISLLTPVSSDFAHISGSHFPNIIVILLDDAGYGDIGGTIVPTPNLDSIGRNGVEFRNAYVTAPQCSPSRVGLLTGRYQQHFGHESNTEFLAALSQPSTRVIPQFLPHSYHSAMLGKWNLGDFPNPPDRHGFHETLLYRHLEESFHSNETLTLDSSQVRGREYSTSLIFQSANDFILNQSQALRPFFLYLAPMSPHVPLVFPPSFEETFHNLDPSLPVTRRKVLTMISEIDHRVGSLLALLNQQNATNNTLIFLINDNGAPAVPRSSLNPNSPLRGFKGELYDGGIRVRYSLQWPSVLSASQVIESPVSSLDVLPTILQLFKHPHPDTLRLLDGRSLFPLLKFDHHPHLSHSLQQQQSSVPDFSRTLYWRFLMVCLAEKRAMRRGELKWIKIGGSPAELYNMSTDQFETSNVAAEQPEVVAEMERDYANWERQFPPIIGRDGNRDALVKKLCG